jgi:hypothetical protein
MNQSQRELRRAAAEAFLESLDHLGKSLNCPETVPTADPPAKLKKPVDCSIKDAEKVWEDAAADIEEFMQTRSS